MIEQVTIIGIGLLGGSLAKDLRRLGLAKRIVGVCQSESTAKLAVEHNVVDEVQPLTEAVTGAQLIVMATPMQAMLPILQQIIDLIPDDCILTDVGSVKMSLYQELQENCPQILPRFVLAHPIAGGEHAGVLAARDDLYQNKHVVIAETSEVHEQYVQQVSDLWQALGANIVTMSLEQHDAIFARTSHLPHVLAFSMVNYLDQEHDRDLLFDMAAAGFYDFTRIASSDATMWRDICLTNGEQITKAIDAFTEQLASLREAISKTDSQEILNQFSRSKEARDTGLKGKNKLK